jgi:hypothetical protein
VKATKPDAETKTKVIVKLADETNEGLQKYIDMPYDQPSVAVKIAEPI